jgi:hypothetical protein
MMITLENTLWVDAVQAIPQLAWRNLHQFRDVPGGMRSVLADEARVRNLPHVVVVVGVCVCVCPGVYSYEPVYYNLHILCRREN